MFTKKTETAFDLLAKVAFAVTICILWAYVIYQLVWMGNSFEDIKEVVAIMVLMYLSDIAASVRNS